MHALEFIKNVAQASIQPVYLFTGEAEFLMEEAWGRLVERIVPAKAKHFNGERLHAKEYTAAQVLTRLNTLPMFGPKQLVMVQRADNWPKEQRNQILAYLERPLTTSCLVLTASSKKGMEKLTATIESIGQVIQFPPLTEREAPRWLQERARQLGKTVTLQAASLLVELVGLDLYRLERELEKLATYVGDRERIDLEDVRQTTSSQRSFSVFELLRQVGRRRSNQAVTTLRSLILAGESPLGILALLARQVRLIWQVKDGLDRGMNVAEIGQRLNLSSYVLRNYVDQTSHFTEAELYQTHQAICEADLALKSTSISPEMILETLVFSLCRNRRGTGEAR
jgi:DNA polymerase-3 subunit delta